MCFLHELNFQFECFSNLSMHYAVKTNNERDDVMTFEVAPSHDDVSVAKSLPLTLSMNYGGGLKWPKR